MFALHLHAKIPLDFSSGIFLYEICSCATEIDLCESQFMEFQYRERYSPVQHEMKSFVKELKEVSIPQAVFACATPLE